MTDPSSSLPQADPLAAMRDLRQTRLFTPEDVATEQLEQLLEVARWTGSAKNTQPWHLVVVTDRDVNACLAGFGAFAQFLAGVPASIVVATEGEGRAVPYDEGRLSERVMLAASLLGLGSGTAWFSDAGGRAQVRGLLGIPAHLHPWSAIGVGHPDISRPQPGPATRGRRPLADVVGWGTFGAPAPDDAP